MQQKTIQESNSNINLDLVKFGLQYIFSYSFYSSGVMFFFIFFIAEQYV